MASRFLHLLSEERLDPEAVTNRLSLSASDNDFSSASPARKPCSEPRCLGRTSAINGRQGQKLTLWERPVVAAKRPFVRKQHPVTDKE